MVGWLSRLMGASATTPAKVEKKASARSVSPQQKSERKLEKKIEKQKTNDQEREPARDDRRGRKVGAQDKRAKSRRRVTAGSCSKKAQQHCVKEFNIV